jgi:hypothetical protein
MSLSGWDGGGLVAVAAAASAATVVVVAAAAGVDVVAAARKGQWKNEQKYKTNVAFGAKQRRYRIEHEK